MNQEDNEEDETVNEFVSLPFSTLFDFVRGLGATRQH